MADSVTLDDGTVVTVADGGLHLEPPAGYTGDGQALALAASQNPVVQALLLAQGGTAPPSGSTGATYSGDPSASAVDYVRFTLNDTDVSRPKFTDAEIQAVYAANDEDKIRTVLALCDVLVARFTGYVSETVGSVSMNYGALADGYRLLGDRIRLQLSRTAGPWAGGIDLWDVRRMARDPSRVQPRFRVGMFDSPMATYSLRSVGSGYHLAWPSAVDGSDP